MYWGFGCAPEWMASTGEGMLSSLPMGSMIRFSCISSNVLALGFKAIDKKKDGLEMLRLHVSGSRLQNFPEVPLTIC